LFNIVLSFFNKNFMLPHQHVMTNHSDSRGWNWLLLLYLHPPTTYKTIFFSKDPKKKGLKVVLQKDLGGKHISNKVQTNFVDLDMFIFQNVDECVSLWTHVNIANLIQPTIVVGGCTISILLGVVVDQKGIWWN
jgi:hypothetical protein